MTTNTLNMICQTVHSLPLRFGFNAMWYVMWHELSHFIVCVIVQRHHINFHLCNIYWQFSWRKTQTNENLISDEYERLTRVVHQQQQSLQQYCRLLLQIFFSLFSACQSTASTVKILCHWQLFTIETLRENSCDLRMTMRTIHGIVDGIVRIGNDKKISMISIVRKIKGCCPKSEQK